jgi:hypothetical protein
MAAYRITTLNVLRSLNIGFKNSFDIELDIYSTPGLIAIADNLCVGLSKLSTSDYTVTGTVISDMYYSEANDGKWVQGQALLQTATSINGTRTALPATRTPYGFGVLITQLGASTSGRKGKLILKTGFWEAMVSATMTRWQFESGVGTTEWLNRWNDVMALEDGEFGQYMQSGTNDAKLVNLHKGNPNPSINTQWVTRTLNRYRLPRAMVD